MILENWMNSSDYEHSYCPSSSKDEQEKRGLTANDVSLHIETTNDCHTNENDDDDGDDDRMLMLVRSYMSLAQRSWKKKNNNMRNAYSYQPTALD